MGQYRGPTKVIPENDLASGAYDGVLLVAPPARTFKAAAKLEAVIAGASTYNPSLDQEVSILPLPDLPAGRLVYSPTGAIDPDYDDARILQEAAAKGLQKAVKAGIRNLLLVLEDFPQFENSQLVTLLGVLQALYSPIHARENNPSKQPKLNSLGVCSEGDTDQLIKLALVLENGLYAARDVGGADPERMAPGNVQTYVEEIFSKTNISVQVIDDHNVLEKEYPLMQAVNRAAMDVPRHRARLIFLEYNPPQKETETLFLVGKGVTYDTGGCDIKAGGVMAGMSRDKCGAAAVIGFMQLVAQLKPANLRVVAGVPMVRNSVGPNGYVADEVIVSRSKQAVRIGNTDAEGRMIMADVLCKMKELAVTAVNPHLFTIATLTGHAVLTVGKGYSIVVDNGPARKANFSSKFQKAGAALADPIEISTLRKEDFNFHKGQVEGEDIVQSNNLPSSRTPRGHQGPAAFLVLASGLDKHGSGSEKPLKYSHLDIAASAGDHPYPATGAPILALAKTFLLQ